MNLTRWLLLLVLALAGLQSWRLSEEQGAHAQTRADFATYRKDAEKKAREASERNRKTEQELIDARAQNEAKDQALLEAALLRDRAARLHSQQLQDAARAAADAARARCAASPPPGYSTPGPDPIGVLADVLGRADQRAGELAAIADERRIRGLACEREYDAARQALKSDEVSP